MTVDLAREFGGAIPSLPAHLDGAGYEAYLAAVPGTQLAAIYDRWGARLLEQNVRCFLQARSNVNKGIRNTLQNDPHMFFAYNNGITATAEGVEVSADNGAVRITKIKNLQIVNGGQTTASIHAASIRKDVDLSRVFVQMKLSIIPPHEAEKVVPQISEYANSQNRVNAADFFANHPFHVRMEVFSRRIYAPAPDGTFAQTKWFYERARGQYQDARAYLTKAERKKFDQDHPKKQMLTKTDLAKFMNVWNMRPDIVSRGAQKNFADFAMGIGKAWRTDEQAFNETYYREAIAKAIVFRFTEAMVSRQAWYQGGYRANVVAYAIAKLAHDLERAGLSFDFEAVWKAQEVPAPAQRMLEAAAEAVEAIITSPAPGIKNVTEWAKKQACRERVSALQISWPKPLGSVAITKGERKQVVVSGKKDQKVLNGIEAQILVVNTGPEIWAQLLAWGSEKKLLSERERGILGAAATPGKTPSDKQSLVVIEILRKLREEGCVIGREVPGLE